MRYGGWWRQSMKEKVQVILSANMSMTTCWCGRETEETGGWIPRATLTCPAPLDFVWRVLQCLNLWRVPEGDRMDFRELSAIQHR